MLLKKANVLLQYMQHNRKWQQMSLLQLRKLQKFKKRVVLEDYTRLLYSTDKTKAKKILNVVLEGNPRLAKFCAKTSILDIKQEQLMQMVSRCDDWIMVGFIGLFERIEELRMAETQKQNSKLQQQLSLYNQNHNAPRINESIASAIAYTPNLNSMSEDIAEFEEKYGQFDLISKRARLLDSIIDSTYSRLSQTIKKTE